MPTQEVTPTTYLVINGVEACALTERGEVVCAPFIGTRHATNGEMAPVIGWHHGTLADPRGAGGHEGFAALNRSLREAERTAKLGDMAIIRVPDEDSPATGFGNPVGTLFSISFSADGMHDAPEATYINIEGDETIAKRVFEGELRMTAAAVGHPDSIEAGTGDDNFDLGDHLVELADHDLSAGPFERMVGQWRCVVEMVNVPVPV